MCYIYFYIMENQSIIEMKVRGLALEQDHQMPLVILQDVEKQKTLAVTIGPSEASSIIIELEGIQLPRPHTHDIIVRLFERHKFKMLCLEIYAFLDNKYLSRIHYSKGTRKYTMEIRPSDGIALALKLEAPIFSSTSLLSWKEGDPLYVDELDPLSPDVLYIDTDNRNIPFM